MTPLAVIELANTIAKLILLGQESKPEAQRRAEAVLAWTIFWAFVRPVLPADLRAQIEAELAKVPRVEAAK